MNGINETGLSREAAVRYRLSLRECIFGDAGFYRQVAAIAVPIVIQSTLTNVVSLLDNVMVGRVGTLPMSAVAIVNQLFFVFNLAVFGAVSGAGIYTTQYFGKGDEDGVRYTIRYKLLATAAIFIGAVVLFLTAGEKLIDLYIAKETPAADRLVTLALGKQYLYIMLVGLGPFVMSQCYGSTLRESGQTVLPMTASIVSMAMNFVLNLLLIFGYLGFPRLGVAGAAIATVISRFAECAIVIVFGHTRKEQYPFLTGIYRGFRIPGELFARFMTKSLPLLLNESMFSLGKAALLQSYSFRGIEVVAAFNICATVSQLFRVGLMSMGNATSIMIGQELGADRLVNARRSAWRLSSLSIAVCALLGAALFAIAPVVPRFYNTAAEIQKLAVSFIRISALIIPIDAYVNVTYFTLRAGGLMFITILFDSFFVWAATVTTAFALTRFTTLPIITIFAVVSSLEILKFIIGFAFMKHGGWVRNIVAGSEH